MYADNPPTKDNEYLTETQLAREFHVSPRTLQRHRQEGVGIPFVRFGRRILYRRSDAEAYAAGNTFQSTAQASQHDPGRAALARGEG